MDPISLTAAVLSIMRSVTIVNDTVRLVSSLKNAPLEFLDLRNELETVRGYLDVLRSVVASIDPDTGSHESSPEPAVTAHIETTLRLLEDDVNSLTALSNTFLARETGDVRKIKWRRRKPVITAHLDKIRHRRLELAHAVGLLQPVQSQNHGALLVGIHQVANTGFHSLERMVEESARRLQGSLDSLKTDRSQGSEPGLDPRATTTALAYPKPQEQLDSRVDVVVTIRRKCPQNCLCQCHFRQTTQTPGGVFSRVLGQLFLNYSSVPVWDPRPCNRPGCNNEERTDSMLLRYAFPAWLLRRLLAFSASWGSLTGQGASLHMRVSRVLPDSHPVWNAILSCNTNQVRSLIEAHEVLPTDVNPRGMSVFYYSLLDSDNAPLRNYLLPLAGRGQVNNRESGLSGPKSPWALARVVTRVWSQKLAAETLESYQRIVDAGEDEEEMSFPVHDAVCARGPPHNRSLSIVQDAIRTHPSAINLLDSISYTPLQLAIYLDDSEVVSLLLAWGADPNFRGSGGTTPLIQAVKLPAPKCAKVLIQNGANLDELSDDGVSCLGFSAASLAPVELTDLLLRHGADPRRGKEPPLHRFLYTFFDPEEAAIGAQKLRLFLNAGLHIDEPDRHGVSALFRAVQLDYPSSTKAFLEHGASPSFVTPECKGLLHYAAAYARKATLGVLLAHAELRSLDPDLRSAEGKTAAEYFVERVNPPQSEKATATEANNDDIEAWNRLLDLVNEGRD